MQMNKKQSQEILEGSITCLQDLRIGDVVNIDQLPLRVHRVTKKEVTLKIIKKWEL